MIVNVVMRDIDTRFDISALREGSPGPRRHRARQMVADGCVGHTGAGTRIAYVG